MKKTLLAILYVFIIAAPAFAQTGFGTNPELNTKCARITQAMAQELYLSELDYIKLKALNCDRLVKTEEMVTACGSNEDLLREKMQEVKLAYEKEIATILSPRQLQAYNVYSKESSDTTFVTSTSKK